MNPECCGKESKTSNRQSKASHPARKVACFCPPTMHDTKLDQLNKAVSWLCRLWHAMTGHMPQASVATILAATTAEGQCASEALLQTWHRLRLAVLHSIWAASQVAQHASATQLHPPASPAPSQPPAQLTNRLALKTVSDMNDALWMSFIPLTQDVMLASS